MLRRAGLKFHSRRLSVFTAREQLRRQNKQRCLSCSPTKPMWSRGSGREIPFQPPSKQGRTTRPGCHGNSPG